MQQVLTKSLARGASNKILSCSSEQYNVAIPSSLHSLVMRVAFLLSAVAHAVALGILAWIPLRTVAWETAVNAGRPMTLQVSFAAEAAEAPGEPVQLEAPPAEPALATEVTVQKQIVESPVPATTFDAPAELRASQQPSQAIKREEPIARQPPQTITATLKTPPRTPPQPRQISVETSVAMATLNAELGAKVDELPRKMRSNPAPPYPPDALLRRDEGRVVLRALVSAAGLVEMVAVEKSSGVTSLDASAVSTVKQWRFSPARRAGTAVAYEVLVPVSFSIRS